MKREIRIFFTAVMFLTRLKVPRSTDHDPAYLQQSPRYFPVVGWIVGGISALVFLVFTSFISSGLGIAASMVASLLVTGAFHEDGWADVCDGFGGGWTKEKILLIMKDSRIGAFGAIGLIAILGCKYLLLKELSSFTPNFEHPASMPFHNYRYFIILLLGAHGLSRMMAVIVMQKGVYVADPAQSKSRDITGGRLSFPGLAITTVLSLAPLVFLPWYFLLAILPAGYVSFELYRYFKRWIGGYTGDCLGAIQQVTEIVLYLGFVVVWRYF